MGTEYLIVARVRRPHGVRGEVLVTVDTDQPGHVFRTGREFPLGNQSATPVGGRVVLERFRSTSGGAILRFADLSSRESVDGLRGMALLIPADEARGAAADEVHQRDLIGIAVVAAGRTLGTVRDIIEVGAGEMLVVRGESANEILIPLVSNFVTGVDLERRELRLDLPEGFLDI